MDLIQKLIGCVIIAWIITANYFAIVEINRKDKTRKQPKPIVDSLYIQSILDRVVSIKDCKTVNDFKRAIESLREAEKRLKFMRNHFGLHPDNCDNIAKASKYVEIQLSECQQHIDEIVHYHTFVLGANIS